LVFLGLAFRIAYFFIVAVLAVSCSKQERARQNSAERGKYLVTLGGCHDCHTPKIQGPNGAPTLEESKLLSGHPANLPPPLWSFKDMKERGVAAVTNPSLTAWVGPWGASFVSNLTPDRRRISEVFRR